MAQGHFIITDISGYTAFLTRSELEHAHDILQSLFKAQLGHIKPPFVISGFRGDAIFMYIPETSFVQPQSVLEALENLYCAFSSTLKQMQYHTTCTCRACKGLALLDLKMVVHYGSYLVQQMGDREELLGADVIVPHRMLKNSVIEQTGIKAYALFSEAAMQALRLREFCAALYDYADSYEHIGEVKMVVYDLSTAWEREQARRQKAIPAEEAWVKYEAEVAAPPSLVWDYLTTPHLKVQMTGLNFMKRTDARGGRVGEGTQFHCAHGDVEFQYKIVDWKPFNYFTVLQTDNATHLNYYETYYFIPTESGTHFMSCVSQPKGDVPAEAQGMFQDLWNQALGRIKAFIEQDIASGKVTASLNTNPAIK
jgi:uncharacterized protein YndB with AHSA1/START domain